MSYTSGMDKPADTSPPDDSEMQLAIMYERARDIASRATDIIKFYEEDGDTSGIMFPLATLSALTSPESDVLPLPPDLLSVAASARACHAMAASHGISGLAAASMAVSNTLIAVAMGFDEEFEIADALLDRADDDLDFADEEHQSDCPACAEHADQEKKAFAPPAVNTAIKPGLN